LAIKNGKAFIGGAFVSKDVLIAGGKIAKIGTNLKGDENVDASGMLVLPGLIDPHVHLREPGDTYKEDFTTGSKAAIAGGFTTVIDMPNNQLPTITAERLKEKERLAKNASCDVLFHFGGTDDNFDEVRVANPRSLKLYLGKTTGELMLRDPSSMQKHFASFPKDRPVVLHACGHEKDEAKDLERAHSNIEAAVSAAKQLGRRIHIAHVSTENEILLAKKYRGCTVEVAPHHLFLSKKDMERLGPYGKVYPALRSEQKRIKLWSVLHMADCIATDHAPHTIEDKEAGAAGFPGLETSLALMLDACGKGLLDRIWVARAMSENVAEAFNLQDRGRLEIGCRGDVTIVDRKKSWKVDGGELQTKCRWSPFDGMRLKGKAETVILEGKIVYEDGQFF